MIGLVALALGAVAAIALAALVARRTGLPSPVLLAVAGLVYATLPGRNVVLDPEVVLVLVIPPLLYSAALNASLLDIRANQWAVGSLSVGLVLATALIVGAVAALVVPGLPFAAGCALGAIVAPTDAVAAIAIGRRLGLPRRLLTIIEGEGLVNDATALTTYRVAVAAVGGGFSLLAAAGDFLLSAGGGAAIGLAVAWLVGRVRRRLEEPLVENALSLATPFLAYLPAEELHVSGVLAVVVCGLVLGHQAPVLLSGAARLQARAVWRLIDFLLEGLVFLLIGNQLPRVLRDLQPYSAATLLTSALAVVAATVLVRPAWIALASALSRLVALRRHTRDPAPSWRHQVVLSWAGTRGVISLAAAFALPLTVDGGPFPARDLLLFPTFIVVLATLIGQGLTLTPLLRRLGMRPEPPQLLEQAAARHAAVRAGLRRLDALVAEDPPPDGVADRLAESARERQNAGWERLGGGAAAAGDTPSAALARLRRQMIAAEREELLRWRDAGRLDDGSLRLLERELDFEESLLPSPAAAAEAP